MTRRKILPPSQHWEDKILEWEVSRLAEQEEKPSEKAVNTEEGKLTHGDREP